MNQNILMNKMKKLIDKLSQENRFSNFSPIFRLFICIHILKDIYVTNDFKELLFKGELFLTPNNSFILESIGVSTSYLRYNYDIFIIFFVIFIVLYFFGIAKYYIGFIIYLFYDVFQNLNPVTLNGGDNILKFSILYMAFINSYNLFSIRKIEFQKIEFQKFSNFISNLAGYSICIHLGLAYFLSAIHKINSDVWFNGVATYYTLSLERFQGTRFNLTLAKNAIFVTISTYLTILIELLHPFLVWVKSLKFFFIISAILLHSSIAILMMLYDFQIVFIILQGFYLSNKEVQNYILFPINKLIKIKLNNENQFKKI